MLALIGFIMIAVIIFALMQGKISPMPVFVIVPIVAIAVVTLLSYVAPQIIFAVEPDAPLPPPISLTQIFDFIKSGVTTTMPVAVLFIFSIVFFGVMTDVGLFDPMVNALVKVSGSNVIIVTIATAILSTCTHLDGALASTLLITCPAMLPIYKRLHIRPVVMLAIIGASMSIMNLLPWGGPVARLGTILNIDPGLIWKDLIPLQITVIFVNIGFAVFLGMMENKRITAAIASGEIVIAGGGSFDVSAPEDLDPKVAALKRPKLVWVNAAITFGVLGLLTFTKIPLYGAFMIGLALTLVINFPNPKDQSARIKAHAGEALSIPAILLASGIFLGVLSGSGMLAAMAKAIIAIIPGFMGPFLHLILGIFAVPIGMMLGTDSYFFGLVPLAIEVGQNYNIAPQAMAYSMLLGKNYGVLVTPHAATTFLAIGLAGIELKELFRFCIPLLWVLSLISLVIAILFGIIPIMA